MIDSDYIHLTQALASEAQPEAPYEPKKYSYLENIGGKAHWYVLEK